MHQMVFHQLSDAFILCSKEMAIEFGNLSAKWCLLGSQGNHESLNLTKYLKQKFIQFLQWILSFSVFGVLKMLKVSVILDALKKFAKCVFGQHQPFNGT